MKYKYNQIKSTKHRILDAALEEFSTHGFEGARVDRIAHQASVNKAMIFYYFSSKQNLYHTLIKNVLLDFIPQVQKMVLESSTPDRLFETFPALYIRYFSRKKEVIKMIVREMIHAPRNITPLIREIFAEYPTAPSRMFKAVITGWHSKGLISESDPVQFIFNIVPLCLFPIIAQPMVEAIMDVEITDDHEFLEKRIQSITHLLKRGMLP
jgi:TetR/AcrR family transcriptional regulator